MANDQGRIVYLWYLNRAVKPGYETQIIALKESVWYGPNKRRKIMVELLQKESRLKNEPAPINPITMKTQR